MPNRTGTGADFRCLPIILSWGGNNGSVWSVVFLRADVDLPERAVFMGSLRMRARPARRKRACSVSDTLRLFAKTRERLARLTDDLRIALSLVVVDGLSYEEAAERLNVSMPEYLSRLAVAREALGVMVAYDERPRALAAE
jgi:predicted DNA-binding protein (UPF0251 family)